MDIENKVINLYVNEGVGYVRISKELGISNRKVLKILRGNNIKMRTVSEGVRLANIRKLYPRGKPKTTSLKGKKRSERFKERASETRRKRIKEGKIEHPRGMLGKHHTLESIDKMKHSQQIHKNYVREVIKKLQKEGFRVIPTDSRSGFPEPDLVAIDFENRKVYAIEIERYHNRTHLKYRMNKYSTNKYFDDIMWFIFGKEGLKRWT